MATANFERALAHVLGHEGGYVDHPRDPGGATNLGITIATLSNWLGRPATKAEVRALTKDKVGPIYRARYWDAVRASELPDGIDLATFDPAVNSGPARGARWLQAALGVTQDGAVGPQTVAAAVQAPDKVAVIKKLCAKRLGFLQGLKTFATFGKGWTRRVAHVEATAIAWAATAAGAKPSDTLASEGKQASTSAKGNAGGAAATGGGGGAIGSQVDPGSLDAMAIAALVVFGAAVVITIAVLAWRSHVQSERARALAAAAQEG